MVQPQLPSQEGTSERPQRTEQAPEDPNPWREMTPEERAAEEAAEENRRYPKATTPRMIVVTTPGTIRIPTWAKSIAAAAVLLGAIWYGISWFNNDPIDIGSAPQNPPAVQAPAPAVATDLQAFIMTHGPWLTTQQSMELRSKAGVRNLALFRSNGLMYSSQSVAFTDLQVWKKVSAPPEFTGLTVSGTSVRLRTQKGEIYTLNVTQPFMIEGNLNQIFAITQQGEVYAIPLAGAIFADANAVAETTKLPANPDLTVSVGSR